MSVCKDGRLSSGNWIMYLVVFNLIFKTFAVIG
nr:MAG TPA: hypothetical protein [Caudoviricetes sp.]DAX34129.1 MAG TPA: hypothetical protein [Caudoviricetes sp.]